MERLTDLALVNLCLSGERDAFSILISRHEIRVRKTILAVYPTMTELDDLLQESFLQAFLNLSTLRDPAHFRSWVCGIGLNLAKMSFRAVVRSPLESFGLEFRGSNIGYVKRDIEATLEHQQRMALLFDAIADLPQSERDAILLIYRDGFSQKETAVKLNTTPNAIKVRAHRGRNRLKKQLQTHEEFAPQKETIMIPVSIYDLVQKADRPSEDFDKQKILAPFLNKLPSDIQKVLLEQSELNWHLPILQIQPHVEELDEHQVDALREVMQALLPHRIVLLKEDEGERILPIWIGPFEAELIRVQLQQVDIKRPLSHDMIKSLLDASGTAVQSATVSKLHDRVYFGELKIMVNGQEKIVDCRPSDALTLATRVNCPIFVAPEIMDAEATILSDIQTQQERHYQWERAGKVNQMKSIL